MAKIPNWSRLKAGRNVEMVWKNDETDARVDIRKQKGAYVVYTPSEKLPRRFGKKDNAREWAVEWMRDNPEPLPKP